MSRRQEKSQRDTPGIPLHIYGSVTAMLPDLVTGIHDPGKGLGRVGRKDAEGLCPGGLDSVAVVDLVEEAGMELFSCGLR